MAARAKGTCCSRDTACNCIEKIEVLEVCEILECLNCNGFLAVVSLLLAAMGAFVKPGGRRQYLGNTRDDVPAGRVAAFLHILIRFYQREISPKRPPCCRFAPTCSAYAIDALRVHGAVRGVLLAVDRLRRCRVDVPRGTADPVPLKRVRRRVSSPLTP
jgi:putative membrane protein insertion efficiency factor